MSYEYSLPPKGWLTSAGKQKHFLLLLNMRLEIPNLPEKTIALYSSFKERTKWPFRIEKRTRNWFVD